MAIPFGELYGKSALPTETTMDLVDLIVLACSLASPSACHEYHILLPAEGSLQRCTMLAQPYLAQWVGDHPNVRVARWHCAWPEREDEKS